MAPSAYDVASILYDPYSSLKNELRERLLAYYASRMTESADSWFNADEFAESLIYCRLQRHMQALREQNCDMPVIVLSADIQETKRNQCLDLGVVGFISKPPKKDEILTMVEKALNSRRN